MDEIEEQKEVRHPRQCIADYCLYHCEKKEMRNSRRSVSECLLVSCPLWPYRTGKLKWEKPEKDMSKTKRERRVKRLESARRKVEQAEKWLKYSESDFERVSQRVESDRKKVDEAKAYVKQLEAAFYVTEDPDGIWR